MRIPLKAKLEKLASKDASRPVLASLYLRITGEGDERRGFLEGTDSYKLGRVPVELDADDTEGFVPVDVLTMARKMRCDTIRANGALEVYDGARPVSSHPRPELGQFPDTDRLMALEPAQYEGRPWQIGLSSKLLRELAEGMGTDGVTLEFTAVRAAPGPDGEAPAFGPSNLRPVTVRPLSNSSTRPECPDAVGILMPIRQGS